MNSRELKKKYLEFFKKKKHAAIAGAPLIPEHDPSVLFTTAGMHPLVPFLMGEPHPKGNKLANFQKCIRTGDIDEVGDDVHLTFFEMLGNWSLGDYFKKEAIELSFEFLTKELKLKKENLAVSCFAGDKDAPKDEFSAKVWQELGIPKERIAFLPKSENWWGPAGETGPCGPDTEMFFWKEDKPAPKKFDTDNESWVEIWNDVFMEYNKTKEGKYVPLKQKNVDTGMGVERVVMVLNKKNNVYEIETIKPIYDLVKSLADKDFVKQRDNSIKIITDHMRAAVFILGDERGAVPSNVDQGYILRRFIRRSIRHGLLLGLKDKVSYMISSVAKEVIKNFKNDYPELKEKEKFIIDEIEKESKRFVDTIDRGIKQIGKKITGYAINKYKPKQIDGNVLNLMRIKWNNETKPHEINVESKWLFDLFQSFGMPPEMTLEEMNANNITIMNQEKALKDFQTLYKKHQEISRSGAEKRFKGGLADESDQTKKLHTATHLLNQALRQVLNKDVKQKGSNITTERLRFDFNFPRKLTDEEKTKIEKLINEVIKKNLKITKEKMPLKKAMSSGAQSEFGAKYPDEVWVYSVGDFSKEICMGPHVDNTKDLGTFKIKKEQAIAAGVRRIKAVLE